MNRTLHSRTRRSFLQEGLQASLAMVASLGALPILDVAAEKNTKKKRTSVQSRNQSQKELCEDLGGGTLEVTNIGGGSWETNCHGGSNDGYACTNTAKSTVCVRTRTTPDLPNQPLQPDSPFAHTGDVQEVPLEPAGGGVVITAYAGGTHERSRRRVKRHRQGHGHGRTG